MSKETIQDSYTALLQGLKVEIEKGMQKAQRAFEREKVLTYWRMGKAISDHLEGQKEQSSIYGQELVKRLSNDLGISSRLLYEIKAFFHAYPKFNAKHYLSWSHYRLLASVSNIEQRKFLAAKAEAENLSKRQLEVLLKTSAKKKTKSKKTSRKRLYAYRDKLMTYELFKAPYSENLLVDCGFNTFVDSGLKNFISTFAQVSFKNGEPKFQKSNATRKDRFTYKGYVEKVLDGDTLWVVLDIGFSVFLRQKVRLRGINAEEPNTPRGIQAKQYIQDCINELPFIIVKSTYRDKYDRYLVDVYYQHETTDPQKMLENGTYLNQEVLKEGLVGIYN